MQTWMSDDKTEWGAGPWQDEPDKLQWIDKASGLDCLIVRGPAGALCGYVGVAEGHPFFGVEYERARPACACDNRDEEFHWCDSSYLSVHGGLTFSDFCHEPTRERWEQWRKNVTDGEGEAQQFPRGDAARRLKEHGHLRDDYEAWRAWGEATSICHIPQPGRPARVWWLGFDCAHSGDYCPKFAGLLPSLHRSGDVYRDLAYARNEVEQLAAQLAVQVEA